MRKPIFIIYLILFFGRLPAQNISSAEQTEPEKLFSERIFVHTDRSTFIAGDTIWFKAYLFNGNYQGSESTDFFIDLVNETGSVIDSKKLAIVDGTVQGNFLLTDSIDHGFYFLRAYTRTLINQGNKDGAIKSIAVINPDKISRDYRTDRKPEQRVSFFLESGSYVSGFSNSIIFKATDQYGNGETVNGFVFNARGDTVLSFKDARNGLGLFTITPQEEKYTAEFNFKNGTKKVYDLPVADANGVVLRIAETSKGKIYQVQKTTGIDLRGELSLTGYMFNRIVFKEPLKFNDNTANGLIPLNNLPEGILVVAITDGNKKVYAKRPVFIYRPENALLLSLKTDTLNFSSKSKNTFTLSFPDSVDGNFSVSVIAYDDQNPDVFANNSISSSVLWDAEKQTSFSLNNYSIPGADKQIRALNDLLLITENQKSLQEITKDETETKESFIEISGDIFKEGTTKPIIEGQLVFMVRTIDSASTFLHAPIEKDGTFKLSNLIFDDMARFNYRIAGKKAPLATIRVKDPGERFRITSKMPDIPLPIDKLIISDSLLLKELANKKRSLINSAQGKMLEEVVVTTRVQRPVVIINKKYTTGLFGSMNASMFDFVNEPPKPSSQRIFEFLQGKVAGLRIEKRGGSYILTSPGRAMSITGGAIPVQVFLNEMPVEPDAIMTLTVSEIALVKYFRAGTNMMAGFGLGGKLALYTKIPEDINFDDVSSARSFTYRGYSPVKEFTSVDYSTYSQTNKDNRTTLYWNPNATIMAGEKEFKVRFYNTDNAKKFKIVVQGYTYDGKLIDFEKIIE